MKSHRQALGSIQNLKVNSLSTDDHAHLLHQFKLQPEERPGEAGVKHSSLLWPPSFSPRQVLEKTWLPYLCKEQGLLLTFTYASFHLS